MLYILQMISKIHGQGPGRLRTSVSPQISSGTFYSFLTWSLDLLTGGVLWLSTLLAIGSSAHSCALLALRNKESFAGMASVNILGLVFPVIQGQNPPLLFPSWHLRPGTTSPCASWNEMFMKCSYWGPHAQGWYENEVNWVRKHAEVSIQHMASRCFIRHFLHVSILLSNHRTHKEVMIWWHDCFLLPHQSLPWAQLLPPPVTEDANSSKAWSAGGHLGCVLEYDPSHQGDILPLEISRKTGQRYPSPWKWWWHSCLPAWGVISYLYSLEKRQACN